MGYRSRTDGSNVSHPNIRCPNSVRAPRRSLRAARCATQKSTASFPGATSRSCSPNSAILRRNRIGFLAPASTSDLQQGPGVPNGSAGWKPQFECAHCRTDCIYTHCPHSIDRRECCRFPGQHKFHVYEYYLKHHKHYLKHPKKHPKHYLEHHTH